MENSFIDKKYAFKPRKFMMLSSAVLFGAAGWMFLNMAQTNHQETALIIDQINVVTLSVTQATIFYWVMTALSFCFSLVGLIGLYKSLVSTSEIRLTEDKIIIPSAFIFSKKIFNIPYQDIRKIDVRTVSRLRILRIFHAKGSIGISDSMLPRKQQLDEILQILQTRVNLDSVNSH